MIEVGCIINESAMKISDRLQDYSSTEIKRITKEVQEFMETIQEVNGLLEAQLKAPTDNTDNVIYVDFHPTAQFERTRNESFPLHKVIEMYNGWADRLWELAYLNIGNYHNARLLEYVLKLNVMVSSFQQFFPGK